MPLFLLLFILGTQAQAAFSAEAPNMCPDDWETSRRGGCWVETAYFQGKRAKAYVHPRGWVVDERCFQDSRFSQAEFLAALDTVYRKMSPSVSVARGGCLSEFNPEWGRELTESPWEWKMRVSCGGFDSGAKTCASVSKTGDSRRINIKNVSRCMTPRGSGLAGVLFHETLHAAGVDNYKTAKHNKAWELPQFEFVGDRVYAAEAICFFGVEEENRPLVNFLQCKRVVEYGVRGEIPREKCEGFDASFTDRLPPGFLKH